MSKQESTHWFPKKLTQTMSLSLRLQDWWDMRKSGGPIVEQATHFIDLMRYLAGDIALPSIQALALGPGVPLSDMAAAPDGEHEVCGPLQ